MNRPYILARTPYIYLFLLISFVMLFISACKPKEVLRSMYWWKTTFNPTQTEMDFIKKHNIQRLYIRLFDVDVENGNSFPVGSLQVPKILQLNLEVVPSVYLMNQVFLQIAPQDTTSLSNLALQVHHKVANHQKELKTSFANEIQMDCDWGTKTQRQYFYFLKALKKLNPKREISITLRLYPYKNTQLVGIPPADRAMLMVYHVESFKAYQAQNSIYTQQSAKPYFNRKTDYPLPIDVALPTFSWGILFRYGQFEQLLSGLTHDKAQSLKFLTPKNGKYEVQQDTLFQEVFLRQGDQIRVEQLSETALLAAATQSRQAIHQAKTHISLFHLDQNHLRSYSDKAIQAVFEVF